MMLTGKSNGIPFVETGSPSAVSVVESTSLRADEVDMARWTLALGLLLVIVAAAYAGDMMRKSIVFNKKTPDVFYCPQRKPTGFDKMIVQAKPLSKLCEHGGNKLPSDYKSDCYNDVDESEYACKEKYRIMKRIQKEQEVEADSPNDFGSKKF